MANCCVAKQSHRTQAHPTPPAGISRPLNPSISLECPLPRQLFSNYAASNKVAMGDDAAAATSKLPLPRSPLLLSLSLPVFLIISASLSLSTTFDIFALELSCWRGRFVLIARTPSPGFGLSLFSLVLANGNMKCFIIFTFIYLVVFATFFFTVLVIVVAVVSCLARC